MPVNLHLWWHNLSCFFVDLPQQFTVDSRPIPSFAPNSLPPHPKNIVGLRLMKAGRVGHEGVIPRSV
jgi:hypothetical protein